MFSRLILSLVLLLQLTPQIHWKSEVKESPEGNQLVLTGELDPGIDHVTGTVTYMPCEGEACYLPVDWDFEAFFHPIEANGAGGSSASGNVLLRRTPPIASGNGPLPLTEPRVATGAGARSGQFKEDSKKN